MKLKEAGRGIVNRVHADPRRRELAGSWWTVAVVVLQLGAGCCGGAEGCVWPGCGADCTLRGRVGPLLDILEVLGIDAALSRR